MEPDREIPTVREATRHRLAVAGLWIFALQLEELISDHHDHRLAQLAIAVLLIALVWPGRQSWAAYAGALAGAVAIAGLAWSGSLSPPQAAVIVLGLTAAGQWIGGRR